MRSMQTLLNRSIATFRGAKFARPCSSGPAKSVLGTSIGVIGLGNMGIPLAKNLSHAGYSVICYDKDVSSVDQLIAASPNVKGVNSAIDVAKNASAIITVLPNDAVLKSVVREISSVRGLFHIGCSTVNPETSREVQQQHAEYQGRYVAAPIFARPDGMSAMEANFVLSGRSDCIHEAKSILKYTAAGMYDFGEDVGAANVVKLCGNFLIASAIEAMSEALALAEKNGVSRVDAMKFYNSTFLDSAIYKGYGQRISERDHRPGGFALELGAKDMNLVKEAALASQTPMPFLSVLQDHFLSAQAKGRGSLDWSAIGLGASEKAGINVEAVDRLTPKSS